MSHDRIPFSGQTEQDEWVYTTAARMECGSCGEWIYTRRRVIDGVASGPASFPPECQVCGAAVGGDPERPLDGLDHEAVHLNWKFYVDDAVGGDPE